MLIMNNKGIRYIDSGDIIYLKNRHHFCQSFHEVFELFFNAKGF